MHSIYAEGAAVHHRKLIRGDVSERAGNKRMAIANPAGKKPMESDFYPDLWADSEEFM